MNNREAGNADHLEEKLDEKETTLPAHVVEGDCRSGEPMLGTIPFP